MRTGIYVWSTLNLQSNVTYFTSTQRPAEDASILHPLKRPRLPSFTEIPSQSAISTNESGPLRPTKRRRRLNAEIPEQTAQTNPLSRRVLKREAKKARRACRTRVGMSGASMEVDDGLEFSFMA